MTRLCWECAFFASGLEDENIPPKGVVKSVVWQRLVSDKVWQLYKARSGLRRKCFYNASILDTSIGEADDNVFGETTRESGW